VGLHDLASFLAWAVVLAFLMTYVRTGLEALGLVVYPVAFALVLVANLSPASESERPVLKSLYLPVHSAFALVGYGALFVACAMAVLYLVQERQLKARSPNRFYYLLPSLERCDTIGGRSVAVGLAFLTLAIITGFLWSRAARGYYFTWDAKEVSAVAAWVTYVAVLYAREQQLKQQVVL